MSVCLCVCMHVFVCVCVHTCVCVCMHVCVCMCVHVHACVCACMHVCVKSMTKKAESCNILATNQHRPSEKLEVKLQEIFCNSTKQTMMLPLNWDEMAIKSWSSKIMMPQTYSFAKNKHTFVPSVLFNPHLSVAEAIATMQLMCVMQHPQRLASGCIQFKHNLDIVVNGPFMEWA